MNENKSNFLCELFTICALGSIFCHVFRLTPLDILSIISSDLRKTKSRDKLLILEDKSVKTMVIRSFFSIVIFSCLLNGCEFFSNESESIPSGRLTFTSVCKNSTWDKAGIPSNRQECVFFNYFLNGNLELEHINAGFNCCPGTIEAEIRIEDHIISIVESENYDHDPHGPCDCLCLYDLTYELEGIIPGQYTLCVKCALADPVEFQVDLNSTVSGYYCEARDKYPWGF